MKILVLGIGRNLRGDDAAGIEAVRQWVADYPETAARVHVETSEQPGVGLLDLLQGMDAALIVDAVRSSLPAGTVLPLRMEELEAFNAESGSSHGWGVAETLQLGLTLHPELEGCRIALLGIAGVDFGWRAGLSSQVLLALPKATEMIEAYIIEWEQG
jgi:hydrogenase maturation protease